MNLLSLFLFFINKDVNGKNNKNGPIDEFWYSEKSVLKLNKSLIFIPSITKELLNELFTWRLFVNIASNIGNKKKAESKKAKTIPLAIEMILFLFMCLMFIKKNIPNRMHIK